MAEETALVPTPAKAVKRKPRTAKGLAQLQSKLMSQHFPEILENFYKQLAKRVADGDPDSLKMVAEIAKLTGKGAAVNVNVNQVNNNMQAVNQGRDRGFEAIVRKLEMRDAEQARPIADEAVDAEFEDVPPNGAH